MIWASSKLLLRLQIDDPLEAFPMHGACGAWGCLMVGLFATEGHVAFAYSLTEYGVFYGGSGKLLGNQILAPSSSPSGPPVSSAPSSTP